MSAQQRPPLKLLSPSDPSPDRGGADAVPPQNYIYALCEPETGEVRYIGKSHHPEKRLYQHLSAHENKPDTYRARWIKKLKAQGLVPTMIILECVTERTWEEAERDWIARYKADGDRLVNTAEGGISSPMGPDTRAKMSDARKGKPFSEEHRQNLARSLKGRVVSEETRERMRNARKGMKLSEEHRAHIADAGKGRVQSEETVTKRAEKRRGCKHSAETKAKLSALRMGKQPVLTPATIAKRVATRLARGYTHSPETRQKIANAARARFALKKGGS